MNNNTLFQPPLNGESLFGIDGLPIFHPNYTGHRNSENDFALIKSSHPFRLTPYSFAACLPQPELDVTGKPLIVSGWGSTTYPQYKPVLTLQYTTLYGISNDECYILHDSSALITNFMLCAKAKNNDTAHCDGDSGGDNFFYKMQLKNKINSF